MLLAYRGHSCKRPGCKTTWGLSWASKEVQETLRWSRASRTDPNSVRRELDPRRAEELDPDGPP